MLHPNASCAAWFRQKTAWDTYLIGRKEMVYRLFQIFIYLYTARQIWKFGFRK